MIRVGYVFEAFYGKSAKRGEAWRRATRLSLLNPGEISSSGGPDSFLPSFLVAHSAAHGSGVGAWMKGSRPAICVALTGGM